MLVVFGGTTLRFRNGHEVILNALSPESARSGFSLKNRAASGASCALETIAGACGQSALAGQELLDKARQQSHSPQARSDRMRRQWFQERNFAEAAVQHGFKRARWRGLWRQSIQDYLIAAIQNLRIIAKNHKHLLLALTRILAKAKLLPIFFAADH